MQDNLNINLNDLDDMTLGEVEVLEERSGFSMAEWSGPAVQSMKFIRALVFVTLKRDNPDVTWEETGDIRLSDFAAMAADDAEVADPLGSGELTLLDLPTS